LCVWNSGAQEDEIDMLRQQDDDLNQKQKMSKEEKQKHSKLPLPKQLRDLDQTHSGTLHSGEKNTQFEFKMGQDKLNHLTVEYYSLNIANHVRSSIEHRSQYFSRHNQTRSVRV
jgi:hypothetical protein